MRVYKNDMPHAAFPIGGIGTGTISLHASGQLQDFQIFNGPSLGRQVPYTFFSIFMRQDGRTDARVIEAVQRPDFYKGRGYHPLYAMGLPRFAESEMAVRYPFADVRFIDGAYPLKVSLRAFNPFIPMRADDSGIPGAVFRFEVENVSDRPAEVLVASSMGNIHNDCGQDSFDNYRVSEHCENREMRQGDVTGVFMTGSAVPEDHLRYGNNAILVRDASAEVRRMWYRGGWYDGITDFWNRFQKGELADSAAEGEEKFSVVGPTACVVGSVGVRKCIAPGEKAAFAFVLSWYVPNRIKGWFPGQNDGETMKNHYATRYADAWQAGCDLLGRMDELEDASERFARALYASTLPEAVMDAVASNIAVLRSTTCWRADDGTFMGWEGSHEHEGSCHGTCTHVWNYAQTVAFLFPELERSARANEFLVETNPDGKMAFRAQRRFGLPECEMYPAVDGQFGAIMRAWREWKLSGDRAYLESIYPAAKRAFAFGLREWDADGDGVPEGRQHNTYDIEFFGPNPLSAVMLLGAARAMESMAGAAGDAATAEEMRKLFARARENFDRICWQGEYYVQRLDDVDAWPYQFGQGCLSDHLLGQTLAYLFGLGALLPEERIDSAVSAIYRHNFLPGERRKPCLQRLYVANDEPGLVLCSWPNGGMPRFPFVYSDEVWTGIEYQVATLLIYRGMEDRAIEMVEAVRKRFDGVRRSPWSEMECGHYYARAMASWGLLIALSGFDCDVARGRLAFSPREARGVYFWAMGGAWGDAAFDETGVRILPAYGELRLNRLSVPNAGCVTSVRAAGKAVDYSLQDGEIVLKDTVTVGKDEALVVCVDC